jgi:hypothetical protein
MRVYRSPARGALTAAAQTVTNTRDTGYDCVGPSGLQPISQFRSTGSPAHKTECRKVGAPPTRKSGNTEAVTGGPVCRRTKPPSAMIAVHKKLRVLRFCCAISFEHSAVRQFSRSAMPLTYRCREGRSIAPSIMLRKEEHMSNQNQIDLRKSPHIGVLLLLFAVAHTLLGDPIPYTQFVTATAVGGASGSGGPILDCSGSSGGSISLLETCTYTGWDKTLFRHFSG